MIEKKYWNYQSKQTFGKKFEQFSNLQFHSDHELRRKLNGRQWKLLRVWYALSHHSDFFLSPSFIGIQPSHKDRINFKCIYSPIYPYCQYLSSPPPPPLFLPFFSSLKGFSYIHFTHSHFPTQTESWLPSYVWTHHYELSPILSHHH